MDTQMAIAEPADQNTEMIQASRPAVSDMRDLIMRADPDSIGGIMTEFEDKHRLFRKLLMDNLIQGEHWGFPPGCSPDTRVDPKQWVARPSLYQAGADKVIKLMGVRAEFTPDVESWQMAGSKPGHFFVKCRLISHSTGECVGEGLGTSYVGEKKGRDEHGALMMAQKRSKVSAVRNGYGLSELFTQDLEDGDGKPPAHENPKASATPPVQPRGGRVSKEELADLAEKFKAVRLRRGLDHNREAFADWVFNLTGMADSTEKFKGINNAGVWKREDYRDCCNALAEESSGEVPY